MYFEQISTPGLGCFSYVIGCPESGVMAVVDPRRDVDVYLRIAEENGMSVTHIFDTHIHADHVSGAQELQAATNAVLYLHESADVAYEIKKMKNGDIFMLGTAVMQVLHTPGHTPNSVSFLVSDLSSSPEPAMILTGDLLFVGDIGRPDLPGADVLEEQVENLYHSLYETFAQLPDYLEVYPAHGQGSLCGQGMSAKPHTTLGYERLANPMLKYSEYKDFKQAILSNLPMRPQSFSSIITANRSKAILMHRIGQIEYALSADKVEELRESGAVLLDLRDDSAYAEAHLPGSIHVDFSGGPMLNWVGVAVPPGMPLVLILPADDFFDEMCVELRRIGYDTIVGWLKGGLSAWQSSGKETQNLPYLSPAELRERLRGSNPPSLVDVRNQSEFESMHIEGSLNIGFDRITGQDGCPLSGEEQIVVICLSGFRSSIAASLLQKQGCSQVSVLSGGLEEWGDTIQDALRL